MLQSSSGVTTMETSRDKRETVTTLAPGGSIDAVCVAFEAELNRGSRPAIEPLVAGWEEPERSKLLCELLRLEIAYAFAHGEPCSTQDYLAMFPDHREVVNEAFLATRVPIHSEELLSLSSSLRRQRFLGQGGLGIVYVAEDEQLGRETAVKFIQDSLRSNPQSREQFRLEAEITGRLDHPGIVPVHGLGETVDGRLFYVMRLIRGERLDEAIARHHQRREAASENSLQRHVGLHELLNHFVAACKTAAYAHNRGVVHRDLKPSNIMLGRYGETLVIDWGLAAHVAREGPFKESSERTLLRGASTGSSQNSGGGTPSYMSPEQARGWEEVAPSSDIYSLGATLYTVITGKAPFVGSVSEVLQNASRGEFPRPTQVRAGLSKALEAICLKAMSLDPKRRYATALDLAEDVGRYLADAPVSAYQEPLGLRMARWARRHRTTAQSALAALLLLAVTGSVFSVWMGRQAHRERQLHVQANEAREKEQELRKHGLQVSAEFAARTIANQIDSRWRILEKEAADPQLHALLRTANAEPQNEQYHGPLQEWLDGRIEQEYADLPCRGWFIQAGEGTQVARIPSQEDGKKASSLGQRFDYRDYFHGIGQDYTRAERARLNPKPLSEPHNSTVLRSTVDGDLTVVLSVPVGPSEAADPLGVLAMSIKLGHFADLEMNLPDGQGVLLVESRVYRLLGEGDEPSRELGYGLVLHHEDLAKAMDQQPLHHVHPKVVEHMVEAKSGWTQGNGRSRVLDNLLPDRYRDPLSSDRGSRALAAFAPVLVYSRAAEQQDTGWFVIVQQRQ